MNLKRVLCPLVMMALLGFGSAAADDAVTITKTCKGFGGEVAVSVTFAGSGIAAVVAEGAGETVGVGSRAIEQLPAEIVAKQGIDVDVVAGATVTSTAILNAVQDAIDEQNGIKQATELVMVPGTYTASTVGFGGTMEVAVTVDETTIQSVEVLSNEETMGIGTTAVELLPSRIVDAQSTGIDGISGCTASSQAIFLAVEKALTEAGANLAVLTAKPAEKEPSTEVVSITKDIVVIGGGAAGKIASIAAHEKGADVILLEKMNFLGGAAAISGGHVISTGSHHQAEGGVTDDTPDVLFNDLIEGGHHLNDPFMARILADHIGEAFDWLYDYVGVQFEDTPQPNASHTKDRDFYHPNQSAGINADIKAKIFSDGYDVKLATRAYELKVEDGAVVGVMAKDEEGVTYDITAKAVILATGGFGNNPDMLTDELKNVLYYGPVSSTGDGHIMAQSVNAKFQKMELGKVRGNGVKVAEGLSKSTTNGNKAAVRKASGILVNKEGVRVVDENGTNDSVTKALMAQPDGILYFVMDQTSYDLFHAANKKANVVSDEQAEIWLNSDLEYPIYVRGNTLEEVAVAAGIDPQGLAATVQRYNEMVEKGTDEDFGRNVLEAPVSEEGPYYICEQRARFASTLGGIVTNERMQVYNNDDQLIPGLYAAGEIVGGAHGDDALPGCNLGWAYTTGRIAAYAAFEDIE